MGYIKVVKSGNLIEIYTYEKEIYKRYPGIKIPTIRIPGYRRNISRRIDNIWRLRRTFSRIVRSNLGGIESPILVTLTMYQILSIERSWTLYSEFVRRFRKIFKEKDIKFITVPEFQKRGAVHFHILMWNLPEYVIEQEKQGGERLLQKIWGRGFVDCRKTDGSPKLVGYLAKYMVKAIADVRNNGLKGYSCTRNMLRPELAKGQSAIDFWASEYILGKAPVQERNLNVKFLGKGNYKAYLI